MANIWISEREWDVENQIQRITYGENKDLDLHESQVVTMGWACKKIPSRLHTQKSHEAWVHWQSTSGDTDIWMGGRCQRRCTRILWCHNWKLTMQNRAVWMQKLQESKARLQAVVPQNGSRPQKEDLGINSLPGSVMLALKHNPWCCWPII